MFPLMCLSQNVVFGLVHAMPCTVISSSKTTMIDEYVEILCVSDTCLTIMVYGYKFLNTHRRKGMQQYRLSTINAHAVTLFHREVDYKTETRLTCLGVIATCSCELSYRMQRL
jgi:hypothetical protein